MDQLLIGRWQASKFTISGIATHYDAGKGPLYKINPDGKVDFSYYDEEWITDNVKRTIKENSGRTLIVEPWKEVGEILKVTANEMQLGVGRRYGEPVLVFFLKRLPDQTK